MVLKKTSQPIRMLWQPFPHHKVAYSSILGKGEKSSTSTDIIQNSNPEPIISTKVHLFRYGNFHLSHAHGRFRFLEIRVSGFESFHIKTISFAF